ncbi:MAG: hypothetical protein O2782_11730 [bacterium]|nr:hypothetical protein [bacterium]
MALSMLASGAALTAASSATSVQDMSRKRVSVINLGGFLGSAIGLGLPYLMNQDRVRIYMAGLLAGGAIGSTTAIRATSGLDYVAQGGGEQASIRIQPVRSVLHSGGSIVPGGTDSGRAAWGATVTYGFYCSVCRRREANGTGRRSLPCSFYRKSEAQLAGGATRSSPMGHYQIALERLVHVTCCIEMS